MSQDEVADKKLLGRQDPVPNWNLDLKVSYLQKFENFLGSKWLSKDSYGELQDLWQRKDNLATIELLTFGSALDKYSSKVSIGAYAKAASIIKSDDLGNRAGIIFEILSAAMFESENQLVKIPKGNNPGYDLEIQHKNGNIIRVSVKALTHSSHSKEFKTFARHIEKEIKPNFKDHSILYLSQDSFEQSDKYSKHTTFQGLKEIIQNNLAGQPYLTKNQWVVILNKLSPYGDADFTTIRPSYTIIMSSPFHKNEQLRFNSKMHDACENLKKHCSDVSKNIGNVIIIRIPDSISIKAAKVWLTSYLSEENNHVSSVILVRASYTSSEKLEQSWVTYEFAEAHNTKAKVNLKDLVKGGLSLTVPIGQASREETKSILHIGDKTVDMTNSYFYFSGQHTFEKNIDLADGEKKFQATRIPNIKTSCIFRNVPSKNDYIEIGFHFPPTDELFIL